MSTEQSEADLTEVKERVVPAALRSRILRFIIFWFLFTQVVCFFYLFVCACECVG